MNQGKSNPSQSMQKKAEQKCVLFYQLLNQYFTLLNLEY